MLLGHFRITLSHFLKEIMESWGTQGRDFMALVDFGILTCLRNGSGCKTSEQETQQANKMSTNNFLNYILVNKEFI